MTPIGARAMMSLAYTLIIMMGKPPALPGRQ